MQKNDITKEGRVSKRLKVRSLFCRVATRQDSKLQDCIGLPFEGGSRRQSAMQPERSRRPAAP